MKTVIKLQGGLGNQLFQYAFGKAIEFYTKIPVEFDDIKYLGKNPYRNYELSRYNTNVVLIDHTRKKSILKKILRELLIIKHLKNKVNVYKNKKIEWIKLEDNSLTYCDKYKHIKKGMYIEGFYQCEEYFKEISDKIRQDFVFKEKLNDQNLEILNEIKSSESVSLHIRRGDYLSCSGYGILSVGYYKKGLDIIKDKLKDKDLKIFVFTEDTAWAKENIKFDVDTMFVNCNNSEEGYFDLELMRNCKHNIIANSSLSWWGAWLNNNPSKIVIAPDPWFIDIVNSDIVPDEWIKVKQNQEYV